jgi:hypothetical protein
MTMPVSSPTMTMPSPTMMMPMEPPSTTSNAPPSRRRQRRIFSWFRNSVWNRIQNLVDGFTF